MKRNNGSVFRILQQILFITSIFSFEKEITDVINVANILNFSNSPEEHLDSY